MVRTRLSWFCAPLLMLSLGVPSYAANKVLKLDGADVESYFEVPDDDSLDLDLGTAFTIEAWVSPKGLDYNPINEYIVVNKEDVYEIGVNDGNIFKTAIKPMGQGWEWWTSEEEVPENAWSHLAVTWDGESISLFYNGKFTFSYAKPGDGANDSPDTFKVGRRTRGGETNGVFQGLIDEVRLSNSIRYTADFTPPKTCFTPDANTMALYHFDEATNGIVKDASSKQNDGSLLGAAALVDDGFLSCGATLAGDYDGSGKLDLPDVNELSMAIGKGSTDKKYDVSGNATVGGEDLEQWVKVLKKTWVGDANLDGFFNSADFIAVFQVGKFEVNADANWSEGDWNGDARFSSGDFVAAFQDGGFEAGARPAVSAVPEPASWTLLGLAGLAGWTRRRRGL